MLKRGLLVLLLCFLLLYFFASPVYANVYVPSKTEKFLFADNFLWTSIVIASIVNALFETFVLYLWGYKKRKTVLTILLVNLITWPAFYYLWNQSSQFLVVIGLEMLVILFETTLIFLLNRELKYSKLLLKVAVANIISAIIGYFIATVIFLAFFSSISLIPRLIEQGMF